MAIHKIQHKQYKPQAADPSPLDVIKILIHDVHSTGNIPIHKEDFNNMHTFVVPIVFYMKHYRCSMLLRNKDHIFKLKLDRGDV